MDINEILSHCDHTNLKQTAVPNDIKRLIDEAVRYNTASVCIPPCYVKLASEYAVGKMRICTVIGFLTGITRPRSRYLKQSGHCLTVRMK